MRNQFKTHIEVNRLEICDLMLACTIIGNNASDGGERWKKLHDKLEKQLDELDAQLDEVIKFHMAE